MQPVAAFPTTAAACPEQFAATVQSTTQFGNPEYPATHELQPAVASYKAEHVAQSLPVHLFTHKHAQPVPTLPATSLAALLQSSTTLHRR